ncbi:Flp pilus assembly complex ATPase component TadA [Svornostia abyssi]|uniref:Flp pilus assembly complex ATPase component TadA n=1 Tax=Svornostia abyssi TaxID=2898438 RepID=A0ABY5PDA6_9ACTN|nr:Flp pilus assembly complex ATPase component TadA [Parviterribacteraceae bacterium J379]
MDPIATQTDDLLDLDVVADPAAPESASVASAQPGGFTPPPPAPGRAPADADGPWDGVSRPRPRNGGGARFLTDVIVELGLCDAERVAQAVDTARETGTTPERLLVDSGALNADGLARAVAERHGLDHLDLSVFQVDMAAAHCVDAAAAKRYQAVPVAFIDDRTLLVAMADPANVLAADDISMITGYEVRPAVANPDDIATLVSRLSRLDHVTADTTADEAGEANVAPAQTAEVLDLRDSADDQPVIKLVNQVLAQAVEQGASDVHFEPDADAMRVRFRIDGVLSEATEVPHRMVPGVVSRLKIISDLDIAEKRVPQDGRVGLTIDGKHVDLRVVTLPCAHGENVVLRILDTSNVVLDLDTLGMGENERERFTESFSQAFGAVLVTGPTGSGKSTTLYAALGQLNTPEKNIITIEDPVEYQVDGITQVQVNPRAGLTFASGLRAMMRADPDVIMVGEIRDRETAQIAIEAALTGHLVLSTLHTNDAPTAITRLTEMGIEPFLVASAIDAVVAQRLARQLCRHCKQRTIIPADVLRRNGFHVTLDLEAYEPQGCQRCNHTGYKGRIGLYEVMRLNEEIRSLAVERASADRIAEVAMRSGMYRLREDGLRKVTLGLTSIAEVARVCGTGQG